MEGYAEEARSDLEMSRRWEERRARRAMKSSARNAEQSIPTSTWNFSQRAGGSSVEQARMLLKPASHPTGGSSFSTQNGGSDNGSQGDEQEIDLGECPIYDESRVAAADDSGSGASESRSGLARTWSLGLGGTFDQMEPPPAYESIPLRDADVPHT